jgi:hypothetical protein
MWVTGDTIASGVIDWYRMWFTEDTVASYTVFWCMIWFIADTTASLRVLWCTIWFTTDTKTSCVSNRLILFRVQKTNMNNETYLSVKITRHTTTHTHIMVDGNTYVNNDINDACLSVLEKFFFDPGTSKCLCSVCSPLTVCRIKLMTLLTEFEKSIHIFMKLFNLKYISYITLRWDIPVVCCKHQYKYNVNNSQNTTKFYCYCWCTKCSN